MSTHLATPTRNAPFTEEPGFYQPAKLWLYGNVKLLDGPLVTDPVLAGPPTQYKGKLEAIEARIEQLVLAGKTLVCGIHNTTQRRAALVPLKWGAPRVLVFSGGFYYHLGSTLREEPFLAARLWRHEFDARTDLVISRRSPHKLPMFARDNPTVDALIAQIVAKKVRGCLFDNPEF